MKTIVKKYNSANNVTFTFVITKYSEILNWTLWVSKNEETAKYGENISYSLLH